jgi:hypothetical protein
MEGLLELEQLTQEATEVIQTKLKYLGITTNLIDMEPTTKS